MYRKPADCTSPKMDACFEGGLGEEISCYPCLTIRPPPSLTRSVGLYLAPPTTRVLHVSSWL